MTKPTDPTDPTVPKWRLPADRPRQGRVRSTWHRVEARALAGHHLHLRASRGAVDVFRHPVRSCEVADGRRR